MEFNNNYEMPTAVDLFSGGGGLTVGIKRAGFNVVSAVEINPDAFTTYKANHPDVHAYKQDIRTLKGKDLSKFSNTGRIDLVAGCPPCQGFSSLTRKYRRDDPRNELVFELGRLIKELRPMAIMMENVPGLTTQGKIIFDKFLQLLSDLKYKVNYSVLQVADYGVPQNRRRLVLLAGRGFEIPIPEPTHSRTGKNNLPKWRTLRDVISGMPTPLTLSEAILKGGPKKNGWHVIRTLSPINIQRLQASQPGVSRSTIPDHLRPPCHQGLDEGFGNVYGRLDWAQASVTITGGCTTLSKGRFGHPEELRTISVREAALIQTFPPNYIFDTDMMDSVCNIIGNALPCDFAEVLARHCHKYIAKRKDKSSKRALR